MIEPWNIWTEWFQSSTEQKTNPLWVIGDTMYDITYHGSYTKFANEAPIPVFYTQDVSTSMKVEHGGAYNVYSNLVALDHLKGYHGNRFFSVIGNDTNDMIPLDALYEKATWIVDSSRPTTLKVRYRVDDQLVFRHDIETSKPIDPEIETQLLDAIFSSYSESESELESDRPRAILIADYGKGVCTPRVCRELIAFANQHSIPILIDPKQSLEIYRSCTMLKLNQKELYLSTQNYSSSSSSSCICTKKEEAIDIQERCAWISKTYGIPYILVTRSQHGAYLYTPHQTTLLSFAIPQIPSLSLIAKDVIGAGDIVHTLMSYWFSILWPYLTSSSIHNHSNVWTSIVPWVLAVATGTVTKIGTCHITEVPLFQYYLDIMGKQVTLHMLQWGIQWIKCYQPNIIIGYTNGCFDLFHAGHLQNLQQAANQCDFLIVAVNTDQSVKQNKGPTRPIQTEVFRAAHLVSVSIVSCVILLEDLTPIRHLQMIRPHKLFKGADYTMDQIIGKEYADEVILLQYVPGYSTTKQIQTLSTVSGKTIEEPVLGKHD
jgi:D-beta-D-heptose 7-phosphate kinase / D-beta-D-heptose 1-phosphate adenosyltransferase